MFLAENGGHDQHHTGAAHPAAEGEAGDLPLAQEGVPDERSSHETAAGRHREAGGEDDELEAGSARHEDHAPT